MRHKHEWFPLIPNNLPKDTRINIMVETLGDAVLHRSFVCRCLKTGHRINSSRSGIRVHTSNYFLSKARALAVKYNFNVPFFDPQPLSNNTK